MLDITVLLIVILVIAIVVRGPKTLPQLGAIFGRGVKAARDEASRMRSGDAEKGDGSPPS